MKRTLFIQAAGLLAAVAHAQSPVDPRFDMQGLYPAPGVHDFFGVSSADTNAHLELTTGLALNFSNQPLSAEISDGTSLGPLIDARFDIDLVAAIGLFDYVEIGVVFPLVVQASSLDVLGNTPELRETSLGYVPPSFTQGDLRLIPKVRPFTVEDGLFSVALLPVVVLPTGGGAYYAGERSVGLVPTLALSTRFDRYHVALDLGYRWRDTATEYMTVDVDDEVIFGLAGAATFELAEMPLEVVAEVLGRTAADNFFALGSTTDEQARFQAARSSIELTVGARIRVLDFLEVGLAVGAGILSGVGSPLPRMLASVGYVGPLQSVGDADDDGLLDAADTCPDRPEDKDGFEDQDGCPDLDNDQDRVVDEDDTCPNEPEDKDAFEDQDGCPDPDNDGDHLPDTGDRCPNDPEDVDGRMDEDGCPDVDNDGDNIADAVDECDAEVEDPDGFQDEDGCPELDNDGDGLPDLNDLCPNHAEDKDGREDDDGCVEDNDDDGVPDDADKCPTSAETYNDLDDQDGCPEKSPTSFVALKGDAVVFALPIDFEAYSAQLTSAAPGVLAQLASLLTNYRQLSRLQIRATVRSSSDPEASEYLAEARAQAVVDALVEAGVAADRLEPVGFVGSSRAAESVSVEVTERRPLGVDVAESAILFEGDMGGEIDLELDVDGDDGSTETPAEGETSPETSGDSIDFGGETQPEESEGEANEEDAGIEFNF